MDLSPDVASLIEELRREIAALRAENLLLKQEVAELRRRLGKNSSNSGKPPSSDGLAKKPRILGSLRSRSDKVSGGQPGHQGDTLRPMPTPDKIEHHAARQCTHCQAALTPAMATRVQTRQVLDMLEPRLEVTEHQARTYICACCKGVTRAAFPPEVSAPVQYGPRIKSAAIYLNAQQLLPEDRVSEVMHDLFAAPRLCPASLTAWSERKARELAPVDARIEALVATAPVRHLDETGFRVAGRTQWLHTASTGELTHYRVTERRGAVPGHLRGGVIVHDHFKSYFALQNLQHALCNAHHLRELKALIEHEREPWARHMWRLLMWASQRVRRARKQGRSSLAATCARRLVAVYDEIIRRGLAFHQALPALVRKAGARGRTPKRIGQNLLARLRDYKTQTLRFAFDFAVPFTNNQAEQDIRMMKVKMKISGSFRTQAGAKTFATLRTVISTARKQGANILQSLSAKPDTLIRSLPG